MGRRHPYMGRKAKQEKELEKLLGMIGKCPEDRREGLTAIAEHVAFVKVKLDEGRRACEDAGLTVEYDNGGGQKGERENPALKAYAALLKLYMDGMREIFRAMPEAERPAAVTDAQESVLDLVIRRRNGAA